ncbi:MAG TPA: acyl-CoA ligase (AMP-forming), exosortase A system-associated [Casimicrobiaceae bacterium]|nr:acyl-CoA ligase (AMP-forming), exosortase A system-associated [Casimicrobiaceae bacterium]
MNESFLLHELVTVSAEREPHATAVAGAFGNADYETLAMDISRFGAALVDAGIDRHERMGIYLEKRLETVIAMFGAAAAGAAFVPLNPVLKAPQVGFIMRDCNVRALVTSAERLVTLEHELRDCPDLRHVIVVGANQSSSAIPVPVHAFDRFVEAGRGRRHRVIDTDVVAILYTSGSTGKPKGVVLSHRNMVAGAKSVASYLDNVASDSLLAVLPLSFDAGFSQLTTAFHAGARVVLLNHLLPRDVIAALRNERITGLTAVPPLYIQLAELDWPAEIGEHLRYFANTGGRMPLETLRRLRARVPKAKPFLMYGLTEAFRSTYLPPGEVDRRPDSIGKAIPNAEILVLREDGTPCAPNEPGELVHRGALVGLGYWNDPAKTAERYKRIERAGLMLPEYAVFSGDTVRTDEEGYLYFIGRRDEMIKTSGYRVSPTEIEEALYSTQLVGEAAAFGIEHPVLGQSIIVIATRAAGAEADARTIIAACRERLPGYMVPSHVELRAGPLPRNANGKIDRKRLAGEFAERPRATIE